MKMNGWIPSVWMTAAVAFGANDSDRIAELERKVEQLSAEVERVQFTDVIAKPGQGVHGMSPAASKVYHQDQGLSIGGYGEALYQNFDSDKTDEADFLRAVLYFGYKFDDKWVLNTELEFEHASTDKEGSTSVEFAYLDYLHAPEFNFRTGLVLVPMGLVNELHEPTVFLSARRPDVENRIIPATWRENGLGFYGEFDAVSYKAYLLNGLKGEDFSAKGLRGGRQKGSKAKADDLAGVARVDWTPTLGLLVGGSMYYGNSGQDLEVDATTEIYEAHLDWKHQGISFRALGVLAQVDDAAKLNRLSNPDTPDEDIESVGERQVGWYVELGYDVLNTVDRGEQSLTPFVRYETYNTQDEVPDGFTADGTFDVEVVTLGLNFHPKDEIVFKADYQFYDDKTDAAPDQFNLSMGYVF